MKAIFSSSDLATAPGLVKIITLSVFSLCFFLLLFKHFSDSQSQSQLLPFLAPASGSAVKPDVAVNYSNQRARPVVQSPMPLPSRQERPVVERMGIIDENGVMTSEFLIGEYDTTLIENAVDSDGPGEESQRDEERKARAGIDKYRVCDDTTMHYIPCLDNPEHISGLSSSEREDKYERHCPVKGKELGCIVPRPKGYKLRIPWPQSRDQVWVDNIPQSHLVNNSQNWISRKNEMFIFARAATDLNNGVDRYIDQLSKMVSDIAFGQKTRVALDIDSGMGTFGAHMFQHNVTTLCIAPKDIHVNRIQFALERGVPAMVAALGTRRLLYPTQAFDLIHCSSCGVNWTRDDGILLLEINRVLRAGGYFIWAQHEDSPEEHWKGMKDLCARICWELVKKEEDIAIWRKPLTNSCYFSRGAGFHPPLCEATDDPENIWYVGLKACITPLPENGLGGNVTAWPARLHHPPDRLSSIKMDAEISRREIYGAASKYWNDMVDGYVRAFHWKDFGLRNVMDMRAGYGGFAAALHDFQIDCWVMNVVPVSGSNTLPVIYDRGLIGVMHDWCEPFDTYPRTYDLLNAAGLFSVEQRRCNISTIMLEMDRILRPGGRAYVRDSTLVIHELFDIAKAMGWVCFLYDSSEGPHSSWKLLNCEKRL